MAFVHLALPEKWDRVMSVEELSGKGSPACQEAFAYLREQMKSDQNVSESVEYEPLKETEAPSYNVRETPRVRTFFGEKLELFLFIPEKSVAAIKSDASVPEALRAWVDRAQLGGMSRLLRVQLATKKDVEVLMPLIKAVTRQ
ncbi:MAG: hypothetical protein ABSC50_05565 [Candidatus Bathyarchaeia archaeon]|jgi:hypothetical protein